MMNSVTQKVLNTINKYSLLCPNDTVYVALSGGADSVALLHILCALRDTLQLSDVRALHVHHGLRGESADEDVAFVRSLCQSLGVTLSVCYVDVAQEAKKAHESLEEAGRRLRYAFFGEAVNGQLNAKIATAHTASDRAETMIFNMVRGCGLHGLGGLPVMRDNIVRPLYDCTADEIRTFCHENQYAYRIDETNSDVTFSRNRIRHDIVPSMTCINENAVNNLLRLSDTAIEEDSFLQQQATELQNQAALESGALSVAILREAHPVLIKRVIMLEAMSRYSITLEHRHLEELLDLVTGERTYVNLPHRVTAKVQQDRLVFVEQSKISTTCSQTISVCPPTIVCFNGDTYKISVISQSEFQNALKIHKNLFNFCISYDMIKGNLKMRSRQVGDSIRPYRRGCSKTLKKLFSELKIPLASRDMIPVVYDDSGIAAVLGVSVDERVAIDDSTERIIWFQKVSYQSAD